jgi:hypothetical protein
MLHVQPSSIFKRGGLGSNHGIGSNETFRLSYSVRIASIYPQTSAFDSAATLKRLLITLAFVDSAWLAPDVTMAQATPCLIVTLTGTHGRPQQPFAI